MLLLKLLVGPALIFSLGLLSSFDVVMVAAAAAVAASSSPSLSPSPSASVSSPGSPIICPSATAPPVNRGVWPILNSTTCYSMILDNFWWSNQNALGQSVQLSSNLLAGTGIVDCELDLYYGPAGGAYTSYVNQNVSALYMAMVMRASPANVTGRVRVSFPNVSRNLNDYTRWPVVLSETYSLVVIDMSRSLVNRMPLLSVQVSIDPGVESGNLYLDQIFFTDCTYEYLLNISPSPSPSLLSSPTASITPSVSVTPSISPSAIPSISVTPTVSPSLTPTVSASLTPAASATTSTSPLATSKSPLPSTFPSVSPLSSKSGSTSSSSSSLSISSAPSLLFSSSLNPSPNSSSTPSPFPSPILSPIVSPSATNSTSATKTTSAINPTTAAASPSISPASVTAQPVNSSGSNDLTYKLVAIVIGVVLFILAISAVIVVFRRRMQRRRPLPEFLNTDGSGDSDTGGSKGMGNYASSSKRWSDSGIFLSGIDVTNDANVSNMGKSSRNENDRDLDSKTGKGTINAHSLPSEPSLPVAPPMTKFRTSHSSDRHGIHSNSNSNSNSYSYSYSYSNNNSYNNNAGLGHSISPHSHFDDNVGDVENNVAPGFLPDASMSHNTQQSTGQDLDDDMLAPTKTLDSTDSASFKSGASGTTWQRDREGKLHRSRSITDLQAMELRSQFWPSAVSPLERRQRRPSLHEHFYGGGGNGSGGDVDGHGSENRSYTLPRQAYRSRSVSPGRASGSLSRGSRTTTFGASSSSLPNLAAVSSPHDETNAPPLPSGFIIMENAAAANSSQRRQ